MADDEDKKHSNTDRPLKPAEQKSRPDPLPRGVVAGPTRSAAAMPTPSLGGGRSMPPRPPNDGAPPKDQEGPGRGPRRPGPDFNASAKKSLSSEFNQQSGNNAPKPEGPRISQSDFAKAFRQANQKTKSMQQSRGIDND